MATETTMAGAKDEWAIRPVPCPFDGKRCFRPVAKFADGRELAMGPCNGFKTVREARLFIIGKFDGGRAFPSPPAPKVETVYTAEDMAEIEDVRNRIRFAGIGTPPAMR